MADGEYKISLGVDLKVNDIRDRITEYNSNSNNAKLRLGVKLVTKGISDQIKKITPKTPIEVGLRINDAEALGQIANIRQQLQDLQNISINLGVHNGGVGGNGGRNGNGGRGGRNGNSGFGSGSIPASSVSNITQELKEVDINAETVEDSLKRLKSALNNVGFSDASVGEIAGDFERLGVIVNKVTSRLNEDGSIRITIKGLDELNNVVTVMRTIGTDGSSISEPVINIAQQVKHAEKEFERLKELAAKIRKIEIEVELDYDGSKYEDLQIKLRELQTEYNNLNKSTNLSKEQKDFLDSEEKKHRKNIENIKKDKSDRAKEIEKGIKKDGDIYNRVGKTKYNAGRLSAVPEDLKEDLEEIDSLMKKMNETPSLRVDELIASYEKLDEVLKRVKNKIDDQKRTEDKANADARVEADAKRLEDRKSLLKTEIDAWLTKNTAAADKFGDKLREIRSQIDACDNESLDHLENEFKQVDKTADAEGLKTKKFSEKLKDQFSKYTQYFSVASLFNYAEQGLRDMFEQVKLIDSAMTELKKVTNETDATYNAFLKNAATKSKEIGTTIDGFVSSTADFARLGYDFEESQGLAEVANIYAVVGDEIDGVEGATQSLVSTLAAFKDEASGISDTDFAMSIVDKFNEVSNNFAISSGGIGEAMERSASSLRAANNTIDESIAMITAANEVTQNPEKVGNAMKTISMRMKIHCPQ